MTFSKQLIPIKCGTTKSLVHVDDDTATDGVLAIKDISDGVENKTREGKKITNICPQISDNVTTTGGGGNSYGMIYRSNVELRRYDVRQTSSDGKISHGLFIWETYTAML
jgi:hypothetical protein